MKAMRRTDRRQEWRAACVGGWFGVTFTGAALIDNRMLAVMWIYACVISVLVVWGWDAKPGDFDVDKD